MEARNSFLPEGHPDIAASLDSIGAVYRHMGDRDKSLDYLQRSLEVYERSLPEWHPLIAESLNKIGGSYWVLGEYEKALDYLQRCLEIREKSLSSDHDAITETLFILNFVYEELGEYEKALECCSKALDHRRSSVPRDASSVIRCCHLCGLWCLRLMRPRDALGYLQEAVDVAGQDCDGELQEKTFSMLAKAHAVLAEEKVAAGDLDGASTHALAAREALENVVSPDDELRARVEALPRRGVMERYETER